MSALHANVNRGDLLAFQMRMLWEHPLNQIALALLLATVFVVALLIGFELGSLKGVAAALLACVLAGLATILLTVLLVVLFAAGASTAHHGVLGERSFAITDAGLKESTQFSETLIKWGGATRLVRTRRLIYVKMHATQYFLIPRRHFTDAAQDEGFWQALQPLIAGKSGS